MSRPTQWDSIVRGCGILAALLGALGVVGWLTHTTLLVQLTPNWQPIKFNGALCLLAAGISVAVLPGGYTRLAAGAGALIFAVGLLSIFEYVTGSGAWIDELIVKDYITAPSAFPGRISALAATCFTCLGLGLACAGLTRLPRWRLAVTGLVGVGLTVVAVLAQLGYLAGIRAAYSWGAYTHMALQTATALMALGVAQLIWSWRVAQREQFNLARWMPVTGSVTLMVMVACVAATSLWQLKQSTYWRKHTTDVLISSQAFLVDLVDSQRGMRGFVLTGQQASLTTYQRGIEQLPRRLAELATLTRDNPVQQQRLVSLKADLERVISYSRRLLDRRYELGLQAAIDLESSGEGRQVVDGTQKDMAAFTAEEHRLLAERDGRAQQDFRDTTDLLVLGSVLAAMLLLLAHWMASREVERRKVVEKKLAEDLTERRAKDAELRVSEERFRRAFDDGPIGMCLVSLNGRLLKVNRALCAMLGYSEGELLSTDFQTLTHAQDLQADLELVNKVLSGAIGSYQVEKRYLASDGGIVYANLSVSLVRDRDNQPLYFVSQIENIAYRREMDRLKREFISTVSHELRTPLTSIRGSLGLVEGGVLGALPDKARAMVKIAHQNSERLVKIINDILDVEKIESGGLELHIANVPIVELVREALEYNAPYGEKYQVRFVMEGAPQEVQVRADSDRLMQVLANLLSNAAKFSPPGSEVQVKVERLGARVRVAVKDRGTGIPEEFRSRIFEKFAQAESGSARRFEGTGLGLSITRRLVEALQGTIGFTTATGQGTTFYFDLPAANTTINAEADALSETARYRGLGTAQFRGGVPRILHVEDDPDLSQVIETALNGHAEVVTADSLQAAERLLLSEPLSLVVLDMSLPDGNGLLLLDRLDKLPQPPPVVILSVTEMPQAIQQRVAAALVKSRQSEDEVVRTILSVLASVPEPASPLHQG
jgi:PAS domain S-box-containing protein